MTDVVSWDFNRIVVRDNLFPVHLRWLCVALHKTIGESRFKDIVLDFSLCLGITEAVMLPLLPLVTKYREENIDFSIILPTDKKLNRLFLNANWAHYLNPEKHTRSEHHGGHVPALRFGKDDLQNWTVISDSVIELILRQLETNRSALKAVEWSLWEIMDNAVRHAQSPVGGFVQATAFKQSNRVEFVVADAGIGIAETMGIRSHSQALRVAIDEGRTSDPSKNAGNGLYGSYRIALLSRGQFEIHSINGRLFCDGEKEEVNSTDEKIPYGGTSVRCSISLSEPDLLSNALKFKGKTHDPANDYVERKFEGDEGELVFSIRKEAQRDVGSRLGGIQVRNAIENLLRNQPYIVIDFSDVSVISSSFADEVFGRLFVNMGPRAFMTKIRMHNVDPTVEGLIDRAILQRTKLGNGVI